MDVVLDHRGKDARFAVMRSYQPARIERELLSQVFDIVQRTADALAAHPEHAGPSDQPSTTLAIEDGTRARTCDHIAHHQRVALERAS